MLIRVLSDCHLEFDQANFLPGSLPTDHETTLVLAGDIGCIKRMTPQYKWFLEYVSQNFEDVVYVFGNHEFYGDGGFFREHNRLKDWLDAENITNIHVLEKELFVKNDVTFVGTTLWSDFEKGDPIVMMDADAYMYDYRQIRYSFPQDEHLYQRRLTPQMILREHAFARSWLVDKLRALQGQKSVVVTHHGTTPLSIQSKWIGHALNGCYVSDLSDDILDYEPTMMVHGHIHESCDYMMGNTRIVVNPVGYVGDFNPNYKDDLVINI